MKTTEKVWDVKIMIFKFVGFSLNHVMLCKNKQISETGAYPCIRTYVCAYTRSEKVNMYNV